MKAIRKIQPKKVNRFEQALLHISRLDRTSFHTYDFNGRAIYLLDEDYEIVRIITEF